MRIRKADDLETVIVSPDGVVSLNLESKVVQKRFAELVELYSKVLG